MNLPKYTGVTERAGIIEVDRIVTEELEWIFREQPKQDYGIDAHLEVVRAASVTGHLIAMQIKSGTSYFQEENSEGYVYRGRIEHLNYWLNCSLPVILILYDKSRGLCLWEHIEKSKVAVLSDTSWKITVPKRKTFAVTSIDELTKIADGMSDYENRLNSLILAKEWMEQIQEGNTLVLEADEWVNKLSGRGTLKLIIIDDNDGKETMVRDWPVVYFPMMRYEDVFPQMFPWAEFSVDEEFYDPYDEAAFLRDNARYDKEEDKYYIFGDRQVWQSKLPVIRPYESDGEVDSYRLVLTLNHLGKSFLTMDNYLQNRIQR